MLQGWRRRSRSARVRRRRRTGPRYSGAVGRRAAEPGRGEAPRAARGRAPEGDRGRREGAQARREQGRQGRRRAEATAEDQYVELAREKTDKIFVDPGRVRQRAAPELPGPGHRPGHRRARPASTGRCTTRSRRRTASKDNSTVWQPDYNRAHYQDLYFGTGAASSRSRRTTSGSRRAATASTAWSPTGSRSSTTRRATAAATASRAPSNVCSNTWALIQDAINTWVADQKAAGPHRRADRRRPGVLRPWDRNDYDDDGNFNEPDGYIDHFQIVHSGGDQADGDPHQGEDAIWSHRWKAFQSDRPTGPAGNKDGGTQIGDHRPVGRRLHDPAGERRRLACSRTSTATTSACPTTTTPRAAATTPSTGGR